MPDPVTAWAQAQADEERACHWFRLAARRHLEDLAVGEGRGLRWDLDAALSAIRFVELLPQSKGEWAGRPLLLQPWQRFVVGSLFGWMRLHRRCGGCEAWLPAGATCPLCGVEPRGEERWYRRFRFAYLEVPRKNGKTTLAAAIALKLAFADGEPGAEVYSAAPLAIDTLILTTSGWTTMGELRVGDKVFAEDGRPTTVTYLSPIVLRKTYRVRFDDGSELIATDNHLWTVEKRYTPRKGASQKYKSVTVNTEEIARSVTYGGRPRYRIRVAAPLRFDPKPLPIDPYVLGVWLGDGRNNRGSIVLERGDIEIVREIEKRGYAFSPHYSDKENLVYGTILGIRTALRQMGLLENKHIPDAYKMASVEQRMDLLRGLMDTDGTVTKSGECRFVSTSERLARDTYELLLGLGFKAHIRSVPTNGRGGAWIVSFKAYDDTPVFNLTRKRERQIRCNGTSTQARYRWIVAVEEVDPRPARCIAVDSPSHLFLAGDRLIATHNTKRDQARICWEEARRMVLLSSLRRHVRAVRANLSADALAQKFEPLGADSDRMDGLNVHGAVIDELHAHPDAGVLSVIETATGSRRQPLILAITTAGYDRESVCYQRHEYAEQVLSGAIDDDRWFALIATLDEGDDWRDPSVWGKANPNLGVSVAADSLRADVERALRIPAEQPVVLQKRFDVWVQAAERAIDLDLWDANGRLCSEEWTGRPVFAGLDLGAYDDLTAWVLVCPHADGSGVDVRARFWVPEARLYAADNRYREQYQAWARAGFLEVTPGRGQDYAAVRKGVLEDCARYPIVEIAVDRLFQAHQLATELAGEVGEERIVGVGQGFLTMAAPCRELLSLLLAGGLHHGGNPVLRWMAAGLAFRRDPAGNLKPDKASSQVKIDGIVALLMALDRSSRHREERVVLRAV